MIESGGPGARLPALRHPASLLTPASPSPCFSSSCSMLVVPGAAGSNWLPPQGADVVWSKSAGRLLMGDMEDRLSWGEVPRHRKLQSSRSGSWKEKEGRGQRGRGAVGLKVPAWEVGAGSGTLP